MNELKKPYGSTLILGYSKDNVLKVIHILEKFMPPDDYIVAYKDFKKNKDFLRYIGFNIKIYDAIVSLTSDLWNTDKRINRLDLLTILKRYNKKNPEPSNVSSETASKLFELFRQVVFYQNIKKNIKTINNMKKLVNSVMLDIKLKDEELTWLCDNAETSEIILNRVLRYKHKSPVITNWVKENYRADYLRLRRSELVGWLLNEDPSYEISRYDLHDDFEYMNDLDIKIKERYDADMLDIKLKEDLKKTFREPDQEETFFPFANLFDLTPQRNDSLPPILRFTYRNYENYSEFAKMNIDDLKRKKLYDEYRLMYIKNIDVVLKNVMVWGAAHSLLDNKTKTELLAKYYEKQFNYAFFRIAIKDRNLELLKWLYKNG